MVDDGVAFLLVVVEEEPQGALIVVDGSDVTDMSVSLGVVHNAMVPVHLLLHTEITCRVGLDSVVNHPNDNGAGNGHNVVVVGIIGVFMFYFALFFIDLE
jgi:hypothetical protein